MNTALASELSHLTPEEKLRLVEELWDEIASAENTLPIPGWHRRALAEDQALYHAHPAEGSDWSEAKARIMGKS
ncbi:MAG: addiction module protein [Opitutaceae bacterium]|jgi:putative addiction module component (TIGR02574 family)|nr:addiction module protein [Opitutaceae bacterium]